MSENSNIRRNKKRSNRRKLTLVLVLLALCIAAVIYIFALSRANDLTGGEVQETPEVSSEAENSTSESTSDPDSEKTDAEIDAAAEHVYSHRGSQGEDALSFAAYDRAIEAGSKYIEADIISIVIERPRNHLNINSFLLICILSNKFRFILLFLKLYI